MAGDSHVRDSWYMLAEQLMAPEPIPKPDSMCEVELSNDRDGEWCTRMLCCSTPVGAHSHRCRIHANGTFRSAPLIYAYGTFRRRPEASEGPLLPGAFIAASNGSGFCVSYSDMRIPSRQANRILFGVPHSVPDAVLINPAIWPIWYSQPMPEYWDNVSLALRAFARGSHLRYKKPHRTLVMWSSPPTSEEQLARHKGALKNDQIRNMARLANALIVSGNNNRQHNQSNLHFVNAQTLAWQRAREEPAIFHVKLDGIHWSEPLYQTLLDQTFSFWCPGIT